MEDREFSAENYLGTLHGNDKIDDSLSVIFPLSGTKIKVGFAVVHSNADAGASCRVAALAANLALVAPAEDRADVRVVQSILAQRVRDWLTDGNGAVLWQYFEFPISEMLDNPDPGLWYVLGAQPGFNGRDDFVSRSEYVYRFDVESRELVIASDSR